ncbi:alkylhydroperoxidase AhpD family core domain-containing protein [Saccharopolyspora antimicrobica]|uniref:AhpD family alkylhydroperoxidase n=1 Tax=Saccharopolyspora antimicrobica TaxID=455193 RepID=A0A1I4S0D7_9PSEU|nr:carboxymuconolactone decarboxylase family protein [Saccharopolyspora antimicrobica]RKT89212.1 AhpD family alkylhydroperoxidase [Saccharopolyspora antimicrobica]SFM57684.1 alkylhydroperoxidase AhpD family core domain-containing protein [Saccharopolyspora antimicrobica]
MTDVTSLRFDIGGTTPTTFTALHQLSRDAEDLARQAGLDARLIELVRLRASQINGCGYCQQLHSKQALDSGESEHRLRELANWAESEHFTAAERAALRLAESITRLSGGVPDADYLPATEHFDRTQIVCLVWTVSLINTYNRLAISMVPTA